MNDLNPISSVLEQAERELARRVAQADDLGDWKERSILEPLVDVADYVKRIGDQRDSAHYRAEKAGPLMRSARRVQLETLLAFAGWPDDDSPTARLLRTADELLGDITSAVRSIMWSALRSERGAPDRFDIDELAEAGRRLQSWAGELSATAAGLEHRTSGPMRRQGLTR